MSNQPWWLSLSTKIFKPNSIVRPRFVLMERLFSRAKQLGNPHAKPPPIPQVPMDVRLRNPKVALRNWRVIMDKIITIMFLVELQGSTSEWCLPPPPELPFSKPLEGTVEEVYEEIIKSARVLAPMKSKDGAVISASSCTHPRGRLKGGGNANSSYIVCRDCLTRWENAFRAAEIRKQVKEEKKGSYGGSSSQTVVGPEVQLPEMMQLEVTGNEDEKYHQMMRQMRSEFEGQMQSLAMELSQRQNAASSQDAARMQQFGMEWRQWMNEARGERSETGGDVPNCLESGKAGDRESGGSTTFAAVDSRNSSGADQESAMPLPSSSGDVDGEERRTSERKEVLEMCPTTMPVLRVGADDPGGSAKDPEQSTNDHMEYDGRSECSGDRGGGLGELCSARSEKQRRWLRKAQANAKGVLPGHPFMAEMYYKIYEEDGSSCWKEGYVPLKENRVVEVFVRMADRTHFEDMFGVEKVSCLTSKQRREAVRSFEEMKKAKVGEVFSPPRVAELAWEKRL